MTSATPPAARITKPRLSLLIVEGAVSTVAAVLLAWLLLWFVRQRSRDLRVEAMYVAPGSSAAIDAPFQSADVRALRGDGPADDVAAVGPDGLVDAVRTIVARPEAAVVVYVSAPVIGDGPGASIGTVSIGSLIETVVEDARRDVVLALDLAQIDSDRDLGVYGNCPYRGLAEMVSGLTPGDRCVYVLTSSAPAQKSWGADGLGQSTFAYYLREGLGGGARGWDAPETFGQVSVEGLHRYVERHVSRWARSHRDAVQTPMLLKVGGGSRRVTLPYRVDRVERPTEPAGAAIAAAPASPASPPEPAEKAAAAKKDAPTADQAAGKPGPIERNPPSPREAAFAGLVEEWTRHDDLLRRGPYHELPESWRSYQARLLRVERRLRSAWNVPGAIDPVRKELEDVGRRRDELERRLKAIRDSDAAFPLRPARGEEAGRRAITDALTHLTGAGPEDDGLFAPPPKPKPPPSGASDAAKESGAGEGEPPPALADALFGGFPEPYLELQAPAWALKFVREFAVPGHFRDERRGSILRRLVEVRARAEDALAVDRRGLDWIRPIVALGDDQRRAAQDQLFGPDLTADDRQQPLRAEIARIDRTYASAMEVVRAYHEARATWERAAAELPELAEWAVRADRGATSAPSPSGAPLPPAVDRALKAAEALIDALDRGPPRDEGPSFLERVGKPVDVLQAATRDVQAALDELERRLRDAARADGSRGWIALDAALRAPLVPAESRRRALEAILKMGERMELKADPGAIDPAEYAPDPGFWGLAVGLAALDRDLRRIGRADRREDEDASRSLEEAWSAVQKAPTAPETVDRAIPPLGRYQAAAAGERVQAGAARAERRRAKGRKPDDAGRGLRLDDRAVRLLCEAAIRREDAPDAAPRGRDAYAKYEALSFHMDRLHLDYAPPAAGLRRVADELAGTLGIAEDRERPRARPSLRIVTSPPAGSALKIGEDGKAALTVGVTPPEEGIVLSEPVPRGRAFLGMASPPPGLLISEVDAAPPGSPPGRLEEVGASAREGRPARFVVSQVDLKSGATAFKAQAKVFFRGRVDEGGAAVVDVIPRAFPDLIVVDIAHDPDDLEARFGKGAAGRIEDQFKRHPGEGYMHEGKSAAYVLSFKNVTFRKLNATYKRTLTDPDGAARPIPIDEAERPLAIGPGETVRVAGKVTSQQAPKGQARDLRVAMAVEESKEAVPEFVVRFRQIDHTSYMEFEEFIRPDDFENVRRPCYVVRYTRRADDPVREPIKGSELSCTIEGVTGRGMGAEVEILPGDSIKTTRPAVPGKNQFTWTGRIENEILKPKQAP